MKKKIQEFLKPQRGKVQQGYFKPKNPEKYKGDINAIVYRSSWELKFLQYCDNNESVVEYAAEPIGITYYNPIHKKPSTYWIDCYMKTLNTDGSITKWLIEVKPNKYLKKPIAPKRLTDNSLKSYLRHTQAYLINSAKFEAAQDYAREHNMKFGIITENFLFNKR